MAVEKHRVLAWILTDDRDQALLPIIEAGEPGESITMVLSAPHKLVSEGEPEVDLAAITSLARERAAEEAKEPEPKKI
jgi:hypothetical protein